MEGNAFAPILSTSLANLSTTVLHPNRVIPYSSPAVPDASTALSSPSLLLPNPSTDLPDPSTACHQKAGTSIDLHNTPAVLSDPPPINSTHMSSVTIPPLAAASTLLYDSSSSFLTPQTDPCFSLISSTTNYSSFPLLSASSDQAVPFHTSSTDPPYTLNGALMEPPLLLHTLQTDSQYSAATSSTYPSSVCQYDKSAVASFLSVQPTLSASECDFVGPAKTYTDLSNASVNPNSSSNELLHRLLSGSGRSKGPVAFAEPLSYDILAMKHREQTKEYNICSDIKIIANMYSKQIEKNKCNYTEGKATLCSEQITKHDSNCSDIEIPITKCSKQIMEYYSNCIGVEMPAATCSEQIETVKSNCTDVQMQETIKYFGWVQNKHSECNDVQMPVTSLVDMPNISNAMIINVRNTIEAVIKKNVCNGRKNSEQTENNDSNCYNVQKPETSLIDKDNKISNKIVNVRNSIDAVLKSNFSNRTKVSIDHHSQNQIYLSEQHQNDIVEIPKAPTSLKIIETVNSSSNDEEILKTHTSLEMIETVNSISNDVEIPKAHTSLEMIETVNSSSNDVEIPKARTSLEIIETVNSSSNDVEIPKAPTSLKIIETVNSSSNDEEIPKAHTSLEMIEAVNSSSNDVEIPKAHTNLEMIERVNTSSNDVEIPKALSSVEIIETVNSRSNDIEMPDATMHSEPIEAVNSTCNDVEMAEATVCLKQIKNSNSLCSTIVQMPTTSVDDIPNEISYKMISNVRKNIETVVKNNLNNETKNFTGCVNNSNIYSNNHYQNEAVKNINLDNSAEVANETVLFLLNLKKSPKLSKMDHSGVCADLVNVVSNDSKFLTDENKSLAEFESSSLYHQPKQLVDISSPISGRTKRKIQAKPAGKEYYSATDNIIKTISKRRKLPQGQDTMNKTLTSKHVKNYDKSNKLLNRWKCFNKLNKHGRLAKSIESRSNIVNVAEFSSKPKLRIAVQAMPKPLRMIESIHHFQQLNNGCEIKYINNENALSKSCDYFWNNTNGCTVKKLTPPSSIVIKTKKFSKTTTLEQDKQSQDETGFIKNHSKEDQINEPQDEMHSLNINNQKAANLNGGEFSSAQNDIDVYIADEINYSQPKDEMGSLNINPHKAANLNGEKVSSAQNDIVVDIADEINDNQPQDEMGSLTTNLHKEANLKGGEVSSAQNDIDVDIEHELQQEEIQLEKDRAIYLEDLRKYKQEKMTLKHIKKALLQQLVLLDKEIDDDLSRVHCNNNADIALRNKSSNIKRTQDNSETVILL